MLGVVASVNRATNDGRLNAVRACACVRLHTNRLCYTHTHARICIDRVRMCNYTSTGSPYSISSDARSRIESVCVYATERTVMYSWIRVCASATIFVRRLVCRPARTHARFGHIMRRDKRRQCGYVPGPFWQWQRICTAKNHAQFMLYATYRMCATR